MKRALIFDVELREARLEQVGYLRRQKLDHLGTELLRADRRRRNRVQQPKPKPVESIPPARRPGPWQPLSALKSILSK